VDTPVHEKEFVRKLLFTGHLPSTERDALPDGKAKASLIRLVVAEALWSTQPFGVCWQPEFEYCGDDHGLVARTSRGIEGERTTFTRFGTLQEAAEAFVRDARQAVGDHIDGVPIEWNG
jgi:hypothetical protein